MEIRNGMMVLTKMVKVFPAISRIGMHTIKRVEKIKESDERGDLKTIAARYLAMLMKERPTWKADNVFNPYLPPDPKEKEAKEAAIRAKAKAEAERAERAEKEKKEREEAMASRGKRSRDDGGNGGGGGGGKTLKALSVDAPEFTPTKTQQQQAKGRLFAPPR